MKRPGDRLRALASHVFDADTMERLIDPIIADVQVEYAAASNAGAVWRRWRVRAVGYAAFLYVALRTLRVFFGLTLAFTVLFELPYLPRWSFTPARALYLVPQALIVAVPIAFTLATAWASRPTSRSRHELTAAIAAGALCAILAFVTFAWWLPAANQAFRVSVARELGFVASPPPGPPEMTIGELRQQMKWATSVRADRRELEYLYHSHWALPLASLALVLLMMALRRRGAKRRSLILAALPILFGYYMLMFVSRAYALGGGALPIAAATWIPNVVTVLTAAAVATLGPRRQVTE